MYANCFVAHAVIQLHITQNGEIMTADYYDISYRIIYAFDKDPLRYETLLKMIEASSASCVVSMCQDFLKVLNSMLYIG